jgi:hypothetical protein
MVADEGVSASSVGASAYGAAIHLSEGTPKMHRHLGILPATALILVLGSTAAFAGPAGADPDGPDPTVPAAADPGAKASAAGAGNRSEQAEAALAKVQAMFAGGANARSRASGQAKDATMALRDLALLKGSLSVSDRKRAESYLARPTDGLADPFGDGYTTAEATPWCGAHVCVHYVTSTDDAVDITDIGPGTPNGIPDYVDTALENLEFLHTTYTAAGYRAPKSDVTSANDGGDGVTPDPRTDIYLADIGDDVYGYCTTDDPNFDVGTTYQYWDASAYCVLDNDYNSDQFPNYTPTQNLQVTAAHEYFHAVQFAYDIGEDSWLMEATATWVEDEVYDSINDNRQFLANSPLSSPHISLDSTTGSHEYGDWIFFRHLTERFPSKLGALPKIIRDIWVKVGAAEVTGGSPDMYSIQAVKSALANRGVSFGPAFSRFGAINRHPAKGYQEGAAYPAAPLAGSFTLTKSKPGTGWLFIKQNHLTHSTGRLKPASTMTASNWRLRVNFDLPPTARGAAATVQVYKKSGSISVYPITLSTVGDATKRFPFSVSSVKYVELTLTNASLRYQCWQGTLWSCMGRPLDNKLPFEFRATAFRA